MAFAHTRYNLYTNVLAIVFEGFELKDLRLNSASADWL
jgi:hypothetical protein